ncbi:MULTISPECIES: MarR family winged helix-turn-helix transcriptional regulator [Photobacterium]|uniref:MarR family transcriptional regulator n=1 Tax=Photobacterium leiognathi subsp. mandapamensis TaxID=48408 RepID=A0A0M9F8U5_PHOLD|nr:MULTISPECIES: MarR family transcriptional regulator [Photobacterium]MBP2701768.1 MarR family transcriptional regulator [Vibrio parahaemolyticus]KPA52286.1 MarR family transcriptional regulator [Photobacterium leiognathi subsp. mandapamensis]MCG3887414.1 MarR family transcriptional regulator [Photobacterium leiognathi]MZG55192.1 MarR family transcriptional regulator [Photobacterium lucens]MZG82013.1 MarR family transcriptional regulator [Photobacterium lucens]
MDKHEEVLIALRQIIRAIDLHSRKLNKNAGLTGPQLVLMRAIKASGEEVTIRQLSNNTNMSQATATTILDRLEKRGLVVRKRSQLDKRKVHTHLTEEGNALLDKAPLPLQDSFISQYQELEDWEQSLLLSSVQRISTMMNAEHLDVAPLLEVGSITKQEKVNGEIEE